VATNSTNHGGKRPGAGRRPKRQSEELQRLLKKAWPKDAREAVIRKMSEEAQAGNVKAATLLLNYEFGKPVERQEITGADGEPLMQPVADALTKVYGDGGENS
jgi:hypothetical protein